MAEQDKPEDKAVREEGPLPPEVPMSVYEQVVAELASYEWHATHPLSKTVH